MKEVTNKRGVTVKFGEIWFMASPASLRWPKTFPESSWMFMVTSLNEGMAGGPHVNWKRKGKDYVSRTLDEFGTKYNDPDEPFSGLRKATDEEIAYFFKRRPECKAWLKEVTE